MSENRARSLRPYSWQTFSSPGFCRGDDSIVVCHTLLTHMKASGTVCYTSALLRDPMSSVGSNVVGKDPIYW